MSTNFHADIVLRLLIAEIKIIYALNSFDESAANAEAIILHEYPIEKAKLKLDGQIFG